jgi:hypothetical protein
LEKISPEGGRFMKKREHAKEKRKKEMKGDGKEKGEQNAKTGSLE